MTVPFQHRVSNTADAGLAMALRRSSPGLPNGRANGRANSRQSASIGFTQPTGIYDRMRSLNADVVKVNTNVQTFLPEPSPFKASWQGWLREWVPFYEKYAGPNSSDTAKLGAVFRSDELSEEVSRRQRQFDELLVDYNEQSRAGGAPVPQIKATVKPPPNGGGLGLPWWIWVTGGVALFGVGYLVYRKVQEGRAKVKVAHKYAPGLLERFLGPAGKPAYEYSQAGRDASASPLSLSYYAQGDHSGSRAIQPQTQNILADTDYDGGEA